MYKLSDNNRSLSRQFYFMEALPQGTMALLEYNYLVKKVVFNISILPIIKVIAATFIHAFFVCKFFENQRSDTEKTDGQNPKVSRRIEMLPKPYFFVKSGAVVVFVRDLQQIINIALQIGMWATPIMWDISMLSDDMMKSWGLARL